LSVLRSDTITVSYAMYMIFKSHCLNYVMPTYAAQEENIALMHRILTTPVP